MRGGNARILKAALYFFLSAFLVLGIAGCGLRPEAFVPEVKVESAKEASSPLEVPVNGALLARATVTVSPKVPGKVAEVCVDVGHEVKAGAVLMKLDDTEVRRQVDQASAALTIARARYEEAEAGARPQEIAQTQNQVRQAEADYNFAKREFDRATALFGEGAIPEQQLQAAEAKLEQAEARYESAREQLSLVEAGAKPQTVAALSAGVDQAAAALELARTQLSGTLVTAPIGGVVASRNIDPGEMASPSVPAFTIMDVSAVVLEGTVDEVAARRLEVGMTAKVSVDSCPGRLFEGRVTSVGPASTIGAPRYPVTIEIANGERVLKPGMLARALVQVPPLRQGGRPSVLVPEAAVVTKGGERYVLKVDRGRGIVVKCPVEAGLVADGFVEVVAGLNPGDEVIREGGSTLRDGQSVKIKEAG